MKERSEGGERGGGGGGWGGGWGGSVGGGGGCEGFFFNDTATTEIYTLSLHDALPISYFLKKQTVYINLMKIIHSFK